MKTREIVLDDESDRILESLASDYGGDINPALQDLLLHRASLENEIDAIEEQNSTGLLRQRERSEKDFREGNA
ncbi:MAG: hypothetical protein M3Z23_06315, partial [Acidobacteriota bacterium]|nr:hypothetical protein [Acidobacteriota bacterium]